MSKKFNRMFVHFNNSLACSLLLILFGISSIVYASCDSACTGVTTASSVACSMTHWDSEKGKCLLTNSSKIGNCTAPSGSGEVDCSDCICAPAGKLADWKHGANCFCKHKGY